MSLRVLPFESGPVSTIGYLATDQDRGEALLIDCPIGSAFSITSWLNRNACILTGIFITHGHWDHIGDAEQLQQEWKVPVYIHPADRSMLEEPMTHFSYLPFRVRGVEGGGAVQDGETVYAGSHAFTAIHAPGHTPGSLLLYSQKEKTLFTGDVLFSGSVGRTDFPGGSMDQLLNSIRLRILPLPGETLVLPGHGPSTTIEEERKDNPFLANLAVP